MAQNKLKDANNVEINVGDEVYWNDPAINNLDAELRKEVWLIIWTVDSIDEENEIVHISTECAKAEAYPKELEVAIFIRKPDEYEFYVENVI